MKLTKPLLFLLLTFLFTSCDKPYTSYDVQKADQFVIDSYRIKEGKFSILEMQGKPTSSLPANALEEFKDSIQEGDTLSVILHHPSRSDMTSLFRSLSGSSGFAVTEGKIDLPDLPPLIVKGLTIKEAEKKIQDAFLVQGHEVDIFLNYKQRQFRRALFLGNAGMPFIALDGKIRLYEALAAAKIPNTANLFMSYVIRDNQPLPVDLHKLIKEGDMSQNIVLRDQDKIYIADPRDSSVMVMGEIGAPRALPLPSGYISLREALVRAGGLPFTANKSYIHVIRGNLIHPKIYTLNWNIITHLPNDSLLLMPGDTVYVSAKPVTLWNRFISQLFPSLEGIRKVDYTYKAVGR